ncbi:MAG: hypothetical protein QOK15_112 [Nocardioidaceae bacterium]|nr:hypothetical protein [Nocardioidaceae bacterium]
MPPQPEDLQRETRSEVDAGEPDPAERLDHQARHSTALEWSVRAGLVAYGFVHLLIAWVALRLAFGDGATAATGQGALAQLAGDPVGKTTLVAMAVGFAALVLWQVIAGLVGYRDRDGWSRHLMRFGAAARAVTYGYFGVQSAKLAFGGGSGGGGSADSTTAKVMALPAGPFLVGAAGATVAGIGIGLAIFGWQAGFLDQLDEQARHQQRRTPIVVLGRVGYIVKGLAFVVIGILLGWAAVEHQPRRTGGLDQSLHELLGRSLGVPALVVVALGIGCFGVFLLVRSRHLDTGSITS